MDNLFSKVPAVLKTGSTSLCANYIVMHGRGERELLEAPDFIAFPGLGWRKCMFMGYPERSHNHVLISAEQKCPSPN